MYSKPLVLYMIQMDMYASHFSLILFYASRSTWTKNSVSYKIFYFFPLRHEMKVLGKFLPPILKRQWEFSCW